MPSFNLIVFAGHCTRDPQLSYTPSQTAVVDFGVGANRTWNDHSGQKREEVCFVDARAFGRTAENINKFFKKGKPILIRGRLSFDQWTGQDGVKRSKHRITVDEFQVIGGDNGPSGKKQQEEEEPAPEPWTPSGPERQNGSVPDEDIPF